MAESSFRLACQVALHACLVAPVLAHAESVGQADEILVTAPSSDGTVKTTPHGISVITALDIARSTASSLPELLSREANLTLQSFGTMRNAAIDIRGMGATASSNVLVMVDGQRLNENDLSGADLSAIPLSQIQRIEIVRGGGGVRYGNGAVGGVINIITRRAEPGNPHLDLFGRYGSYATSDLRMNASAGLHSFAGLVNASRFASNGYRQNSNVNARDGAVELRWLPSNSVGLVDAYLRAAHHSDTQGLPGGVTAQAFDSDSAARRASNAPFDQTSTTDDRYSIGADADFGRFGQVALQAAYRERDNPYVIGYTPLLSWEQQLQRITSQRKDVNAQHEKQFSAFGYEHSLSSGVDLLWADYARTANGVNIPDSSSRRMGDVRSQGYYVNTVLRAPAKLVVNAGYRFDRFETHARDEQYKTQCPTSFQTVLIDIDPGPGVILVPVSIPVQSNCVNGYVPNSTSGGTWNNRAAELGLTWQPSSAVTAFASVSKNFRNPNIDELLAAASDLRPQTGRTYQVGLRLTPSERLEISATAFHMSTRDEIYYGVDPVTGASVNRNFDEPTSRIGGELDVRWRMFKPLVLRANVGYVSAQFADSGAYLPLVPRTTANAELQWTPLEWMQWSFSAHYVGKRFDGNDFSNTQFPELPAYVVCNTSVRFQKDRWQLAAGVNNLFNEVYSTVAYSATYYPMPERNYYIEVRWRY